MSDAIQQALDLVRARKEVAAQATPGPWYQVIEDGELTAEVAVLAGNEVLVTCLDGPHDAAFIANARNHAEATLALLEALLDHYLLHGPHDSKVWMSVRNVERALAAFVEE